MTKQTRRKFTPEFKAKVALEAAKDQLTLAQLSQKFEVNAVTISKWKSEFLANLSATFSNVKETENSEPEVPVEKLYAQIGKLKVELDFLKKSAKKLGIPESEWKPSNTITSTTILAIQVLNYMKEFRPISSTITRKNTKEPA